MTARRRALALVCVGYVSAVAASAADEIGPPGTEAGARALLSQFLRPGADVSRLTARLRPTRADYMAVYTPEVAAKLEAMYEPLWQKGDLVLTPRAGQTELRLWAVTTEDIQAWTGNAREHLAGGYRGFGGHIKPRRTFYSFKFLEPGKDVGMAGDGLTYVNGHWRIFPKAWRALR